MADCLDRLAKALDYLPDDTARVVIWLKTDMGLAVEDESHDFFPMLRIRAHKNDDFEGVLLKLANGHSAQQHLSRLILPRLEALAQIGHPATMERDLTTSMNDLAIRLRLHASALSAIVMPIARLRLKPSDLSMLTRSMTQRRSK
ncbi:hypothetical protein [Asticcacaulis benevestitus]|uniref:Uncharacterized protein n=2 Tax=Asticcacaulis TaxID=76890 RepID=V4P194_9CAUL|nr:hypothetical protein [Asticcacaulis benevestitus]ESQ87767.1 hypothetical protein ABENE_16990 [Asticcacaulis benevestitus DSM 16100 = ATCC BAA-896]